MKNTKASNNREDRRVLCCIFLYDDDDMWKGSQQKGATLERNPLIFYSDPSFQFTFIFPAPKVDGQNLSFQGKPNSTYQDMTGVYFARESTGFVFERQGKTEFCTRAPFVWTTPHTNGTKYNTPSSSSFHLLSSFPTTQKQHRLVTANSR